MKYSENTHTFQNEIGMEAGPRLYRRRILTTVLGAMIGAACHQAAAQTASSNQSGPIEEVIVTAQKRAEDLQDVPISVSAFTDSALRDMRITDTQELQIITPGLVFENLGPSGSPYIRGVGTRLALNGLDPSVATYIDDRYAPRTSANIAGFGADVARIEVLKGPQGTLYGRNATGGAVRIIKKPVEDHYEGSLKATYGDYDMTDVAGTVNLPISEGFALRLSGQYSARDGYVDNIAHDAIPDSLDEFDDRDFQSYSGKLRWAVTDAVTANLMVDYWTKKDAEGLQGNTLSPPELNQAIAGLGGVTSTKPDETASDLTDKSDTDELSSQLRFDVGMESLDLVSITTFSDFDNDWYGESDGSSGSFFTPGDFIEQSKTFSQEFQLISNGDGNIDWIAGAYLYSDDHESEVVIHSTAIHISQGFQDTETTAYAAFSEAKWRFSDDWALTGGVRYSYEKRKTSVEQSKEPGFVAAGVPFDADKDWDAFTPRVILERNFDHAMIYASYSRGFKSGGYNYPAFTTRESLDPEILDMFEIGLKGEYLDRTVRIATSVYFYDYSDLQVTRAGEGTTGLVTTENAADAELYGLDLEVTWMPTDALAIRFGLNALDSEYTEYEANAKVFRRTLGLTPAIGMVDVGIDASGEPLLKSSDFSAFLSATYEYRLSNGYVPISFTCSYEGDVLYDFVADPLAGDLEQDSFMLWNGSIGYVTGDEKWRFTVWARNLMDEEYFNTVVANATGVRGTYAPPRTYGVEVQYDF